jgi:hypothetical protein
MSGFRVPTGDPKEDKPQWGDYERPGDVSHSSCHSICGVLIFLILLAANVGLLVYGFMKGNPWILTNPRDDSGNFCGLDNTDLSDKVSNLTDDFTLRLHKDVPFLLFGAGRLGLGEIPGQIQICVSECPNETTLGRNASELYYAAFSDSCNDSIRVCPAWFSQAEKEEERRPGGACICPYPTSPMFGRCVPKIDRSMLDEELISNVTALLEAFKNVLFSLPEIGQGITATIELAPIIAMWVGASLVIAFIWILLLRCAAPVIVYVSVILVPIVVAAIGAGLWLYGEHAFLFRDHKNANRYCAGVCFGIAFVLLVIVVFLWSKLNAAVQIVRIAARAIGGNVTSFGAPFLSLIILAVFWVIAIGSCVFNYSAASFEIADRAYNPFQPENSKPFLQFTVDRDLQYVLVFHVVYLIFISVHVYLTNYYAQSCAIVEWYFMEAKGPICNCRCFHGFALALTKGLGTIALSALVMTPIYVLILICEYLDRKSKLDPEAIPLFVRFLIKCMKCCLYCFEKFMRYINKILLTVSQIYNTSWWKSAKITIDVLLSDTLMIAIMTGVTTFIMFISKIVVAGLATIGFICYLKYIGDETAGWVFPAFIVFFLSFVIAAFILGMLTNVIDIVFVCYQADCDLTSSGAIRPLYISDEMTVMVDDLKTSQAGLKVEGKLEDVDGK